LYRGTRHKFGSGGGQAAAIGAASSWRYLIIGDMQLLRHTTFLGRLVLAWFVLCVGVAAASPVIDPQGGQLVCSGTGGMKLLFESEGNAAANSHTLDCALCAPVAPPPQVAEHAAIAPAGHEVQAALQAERSGVRPDALPTARGPPAFVANP
jgi:hypothetical protein